jgi:hypothetical protein
VGALALVSHRQPAVAEQPRNRPLGLPAMPPEPLAGLDLVQPPLHTGRGPGSEPAMRGGRGVPERLRQVPPGTPAGEHVHHGREHRPLITRSRPTVPRSAENGGSNGAASSHSSSGTSRCDRSTPTTGHHAALTLPCDTSPKPARFRPESIPPIALRRGNMR